MDRQELIDNLGTVARSGTRAFISKLAEAKDGAGLIGQFGVGFYSAFMVADRIAVTSRRAGASEAWVWTSTGGAGFEIAPADEAQAARVPRGTEIVLHLKDDAKKYLEPHEIRRVVTTYSDHILFPIELEDAEGKTEQINSASALWQRPKSELKPEDYKQAYQTIAHAFDEPAMTLHYKAEGRYSYAVLLFAPSTRPYDLFDPARKGHVKLYVRRVYITDDAELLPSYLRFIRGVVDSEDLPLNISREMLQNNPQVDADPQGADRPRALRAGKPRREGRRGLRQDLGSVRPGAEGRHLRGFREARAVARARALQHHRRRPARSLKQYVADLKPNQTEIYYLVGESAERLKSNPKLEAARARGIEVLLLSDPVDAFWTMMPPGFEGKPLKSLSKGEVDFGLVPLARREEATSRVREREREDRRGRGDRRREGCARRARLGRARLAAPRRQPGLPGGAKPRARSRDRAAAVAPEPRRRRQADPRAQHEARAGEGARRAPRASAHDDGRDRSFVAAVRAGADISMARCRTIRRRSRRG